MPVDYTKYPSNWFDEIRPAALAKAKWKCERCNVGSNAIGYRDSSGRFVEADQHVQRWCELNGIKVIRIVLSVCHLDHDIENNEVVNLCVMCQKCHVNHDKQKHVLTRKIKASIRRNSCKDQTSIKPALKQH